jgi:hypothetical protein
MRHLAMLAHGPRRPRLAGIADELAQFPRLRNPSERSPDSDQMKKRSKYAKLIFDTSSSGLTLFVLGIRFSEFYGEPLV